MFAISQWFHVAAHLALFIWYFFVRRWVGRSEPRTIIVMCVFALAIALLDAVAMPLNTEMPSVRVLLGLIIDVCLALGFCGVLAAVRNETKP